MIELERHIEILLLDNDCVIVPELGGFMTHHVNARFDDSDNLFIPPFRTVGFNPQLQINDSLLVQSYVEAYDLSYPEALNRINKEVKELKQKLEDEGSYELNDIGTLFINDIGKYEFEPCEAGILTPYLYGLSSFEIEPIEVECISVPVNTVDTIISEHPSDTNTIKNAPVSEENNGTTPLILSDNEKSDSNNKAISIRVNVLRNIAVAAVIIFAFLFSQPLGNNQNITKGNLDTGILSKIMPKDVAYGKPNIQNLTVIKTEKISPKKNDKSQGTNVNNNAAIKSTEKQICNNESTDGYYCIVLASRVTQANANTYVSSLHKHGFNQARVISRSNGAKVIYGQYKSINEAYNMLNNMHSNKYFNDGWIMHVD